MNLRRRELPSGWYPEGRGQTLAQIKEFSRQPLAHAQEAGALIGGIVPHAGWFFSGRLAAGLMALCAADGPPDVVGIFGGHMQTGPALAYLDQAWETPLGEMELDLELSRPVAKELGLANAPARTGDNTIEVLLPLLKHFFAPARLAAFRAPADHGSLVLGRVVAETARRQGKSALFFGSTDLTHYGPNYGFTPMGQGPEAVRWTKEVNDQEFISQALALSAEGIIAHARQNTNACSAGAAAAAVAAAREWGGTKGLLLEYANSYDIMASNSFVGYTAIGFKAPEA